MQKSRFSSLCLKSLLILDKQQIFIVHFEHLLCARNHSNHLLCFLIIILEGTIEVHDEKGTELVGQEKNHGKG